MKTGVIFYNGACPICAAEIAHYRKLAEKQEKATLHFIEIHDSACAALLSKNNLTPEKAAKRLYALEGEELLSGIAAFRLIWQRLERYRFLAKLIDLPGIKTLAGWLYNKVAAPWLYRRHKKRQSEKQQQR